MNANVWTEKGKQAGREHKSSISSRAAASIYLYSALVALWSRRSKNPILYPAVPLMSLIHPPAFPLFPCQPLNQPLLLPLRLLWPLASPPPHSLVIRNAT